MKTKWIIFCFIFLLILTVQNIYTQEIERYSAVEDIEFVPVNAHTYILISYAILPGIGRVGTNHLLFVKNNKAFLFDSPNDDILAGRLFNWVKDSLKTQIKYISVSHWHRDHSGGLDTLHKLGVESYSYDKTKKIMIDEGLTPSKFTITDSISVDFEGTKILLAFYGAGHTIDNTIGWIEEEKILFSGSIIRCMDNFNLGYMKDADVNTWPQTLDNISKQFGNAEVIIPGHGNAGGKELIEHTVILMKQEINK